MGASELCPPLNYMESAKSTAPLLLSARWPSLPPFPGRRSAPQPRPPDRSGKEHLIQPAVPPGNLRPTVSALLLRSSPLSTARRSSRHQHLESVTGARQRLLKRSLPQDVSRAIPLRVGGRITAPDWCRIPRARFAFLPAFA